MRYLLLLLALSPAWAQRESYGALANQYTKINNAAALSTRPIKEASSAPGTCAKGEQYFNTTSATIFACTATNTWSAIGTSSGGTVTVVSSGALTSTALVTGGGTTTLQTPSATATLDSSGNISTPGSISTGASGSAAGALQMTQGTAPSAGTTAITLHAPTSVTSYRLVLPGTSPTGFMRATDAANVSTITASALAVADMPTVMKTRSFTMVIPGTGASNVLQDTDDQPAVWYNSLGQGIHITGVSCITDSATATTIQIQKNDGSPTNMLSSNLSCSSTRASTSTFVSTEDAVAATNGLDFLIVSAGGAGKWVSVTVTYTLD